MKYSLRIAAAAGLMAAAACAAAQDYPAKPIRLISAWTPGGANDILARALGQVISQRFGQPVVIENRPGASGTIGTAHVAQSPADGYTITLGSMPSYSTAPSMFPDLRYDPIKDLVPIAFVAIVPNVLVVNPSLPVKSVPELLAYAKANPGKLAFSSVGNGSSSHLGGELFKLMGHVDMTHVPYKGTAPALVDLVGGRVQLAFENMPALLPLINGGQLRALAVTSRARSALLPQVPTVDEAGLKGYEIGAWYMMFAPAGTPRKVVDKLNEAVNAGLQQPDIRQRLKDLGAEIVGGTPEQAADFLKRDLARWTDVIKQAHIVFN